MEKPGHLPKKTQQDKINQWVHFGKLLLISPFCKRSMLAKLLTTLDGGRGHAGTEPTQARPVPPLKYLSCGQLCSMACTTNWSPLTEVSLWDCYIIAGKWRRDSLFNCDTVNPNAPIIFVAEGPLYSEESPFFIFFYQFIWSLPLTEANFAPISLCRLSSADWIKQCLLISLCAELILDHGTLPDRVCSLISGMSARSLSLSLWGSEAH